MALSGKVFRQRMNTHPGAKSGAQPRVAAQSAADGIHSGDAGIDIAGAQETTEPFSFASTLCQLRGAAPGSEYT